MDDLDFSDIELNSFTETEEITNYVQMSVTYTDADGARQTGNIVIRLFDEVAPTTVKNFQDLVKKGFYNGSSFHRVVKDFMIQGGSATGEASLTPIQGEFTNNGFVNNLEHIRGVVSMARTATDKNSATSQFFIVHKDTIELDANYASFGYIVYGMETVDAIAETEVVANPNMNNEVSSPVHDITINYMKFITYEKD
ncbi:MAG: peptidylprolyl isomerase [Clostridia bacterium]|nr:peptidylprolyl isomerase [Clostridia bacterium]